MYDIIVFAKASKIASSLWWWPAVVAIHPGKCRLQFLWSIQSWNTLKIHPSLTGEGGVRQDSFSNLFWSADLRCKLSAFEESWAVRCAEMHLWDITCARQTRKKDETRTPKSGGTLPAIENSWHVLEQTKHSRLCTKCHKTFPILSKLEFQSKYTDSQFPRPIILGKSSRSLSVLAQLSTFVLLLLLLGKQRFHHWPPWVFQQQKMGHTMKLESYCWWFKNPKANHLGWC